MGNTEPPELHAEQWKWDYAQITIVQYYVEVAVLSQDKEQAVEVICLSIAAEARGLCSGREQNTDHRSGQARTHNRLFSRHFNKHGVLKPQILRLVYAHSKLAAENSA